MKLSDLFSEGITVHDIRNLSNEWDGVWPNETVWTHFTTEVLIPLTGSVDEFGIRNLQYAHIKVYGDKEEKPASTLELMGIMIFKYVHDNKENKPLKSSAEYYSIERINENNGINNAVPEYVIELSGKNNADKAMSAILGADIDYYGQF